MRGFTIGIAMLVMGFSPLPARAQESATPPLERIIDIDFELRSVVTDCTVPNVVAGLARWFKFAAGIEYLRSECARMGGSPRSGQGELLNLRGLTIEAALKRLVVMDPRYRWLDSDGVIVLRPNAAWTDPKNMLNYETDRFELEDATIGVALAAIVSAITGEPRDPAVFAERTPQAAQRFTVKTRVVSAGEALDAVVRAHGASFWTVREGTPYGDGRPGRIISLNTFDGGGIGSGSKALQ